MNKTSKSDDYYKCTITNLQKTKVPGLYIETINIENIGNFKGHTKFAKSVKPQVGNVVYMRKTYFNYWIENGSLTQISKKQKLESKHEQPGNERKGHPI